MQVPANFSDTKLQTLYPGIVYGVAGDDLVVYSNHQVSAQALATCTLDAADLLAQARAAAAQRITTGYAASVADHFAVAGKPWKLRAEDMSLIAARVTHLRNKIDLAADDTARAAILAMAVKFPTTLGVQSLPFAELSPIFDVYGDWMSARIERQTELLFAAAAAPDAATAAALDWSL